MRKLAFALAVGLMFSPALAQAQTPTATCKAEASEKKLAGAALKSFMRKCRRDARTACRDESKKQGLKGAAARSHTKKCRQEKVG
jgi:hypothetical protein